MQRIAIVMFLFGITNVGLGQHSYFLTLGTTKARALAMGSAYTASEDDIISACYNPATLSLYQSNKDYRLTVFLNPIAPAMLGYELMKNDVQNNSDPHRSQQVLKTVALVMNSLVFTNRFVDIALILHEQIIEEKYLSRQKKLFEDCNLWENSYHSLISRLKLAERVSMGVAGSFYVKKMAATVQRGMGFSYGILLKPTERINVGVAFIDFPENLPKIRLPLERLLDQTLNIGISYKPTTTTCLSLDLRNLTEDGLDNVREAHIGFEQTLFSLLAIRGGFFQERFTQNRTFSGGIALVDSNLLFSKENKFNHAQFILNYSFVYQNTKPQSTNWHVLSLLIRI